LISTKKKICIVLINWNGYNDTMECLESISKLVYTDFDILLIDNSPDESDYVKFKLELKNVILIRIENKGFAAANNVAFELVIAKCYDFVLLLNNDTIVEPDFLDKLLYLSDEEELGILTPKINYYSNRNIIWAAGGRLSNIAASGFMEKTGKPDNVSINNKYIDFISGCCMFIKTDVIRKVGLMDENYFLYLEDADFCHRTISAGYKLLYVADSKIYHKVNTTSINNLQIPLYYTTRNRLYFGKKFYPKRLFIIKLYIYSTMLIKFGYWAIKGKQNNIKTVFKAISDFNKGKMGIK